MVVCRDLQCVWSYFVFDFLSWEAHRDVQGRTQPRTAVTRFLSMHQEAFKGKTDTGKHRKFIELKVHT